MLKIFLILAFLTNQYVDGLNRICVYESPRGQHVITIPSHRVCPVSIEV